MHLLQNRLTSTVPTIFPHFFKIYLQLPTELYIYIIFKHHLKVSFFKARVLLFELTWNLQIKTFIF